MADCVQWLRHEGLTRDGHSLQPDPTRDSAGLLDVGHPQVLGVPSHRAGRMRKAYRDLLQQRYRAERGKPQPSAEALNNLWNEWKNPATARPATGPRTLAGGRAGFLPPVPLLSP